MPRVKINRRKYMLNDLSDYIRRQLRENKINQSDLAKMCGCSQPTISYKLNTHSLDLNDLITIFSYFDTSPEELAKLLKE